MALKGPFISLSEAQKSCIYFIQSTLYSLGLSGLWGKIISISVEVGEFMQYLAMGHEQRQSSLCWFLSPQIDIETRQYSIYRGLVHVFSIF